MIQVLPSHIDDESTLAIIRAVLHGISHAHQHNRVQSNSLLCNGSSEMVRVEKKPPSWRNIFQKYSINRWNTLHPYPKRHRSIWRWPIIALVLVTWVGGTFIFHRAIFNGYRNFGDGEQGSLLSSSQIPQLLEELTSSISMSPAVLLLCRDCEENKSKEWNALPKFSWAHPFHIPSSLSSSYSEAIHLQINVMKTILSHLSNIPTDVSDRWIGSFLVSSTFGSYLNITLVDEMLSDPALKYHRGGDVNVLAFGDVTRPDESLKMRLDDTLPGMYDVLKYLLLQVGENPVDIHSMELLAPGFKAFHGNLFVTRPDMLLSYSEWLSSVIRVIDSNAKVQSMIRISSWRTLLRSIVKAIFPWFFRRDSSHYPPLHSMTDCLASYFFHRSNIKITTATEYTEYQRLERQQREEKVVSDAFNLETINRLGTSKEPHLFVLAHNNETAHKAIQKFNNYTWSFPYIIPRTYYFETYFYSHIMGDLLNAVPKETDWIGSISWKADIKANITLLHTMVSDKSITDHYDVLVFWNPERKRTLFEQAIRCHPPILWDLIEYTLLSIGESPHLLSIMRLKQPLFKTFYGSYFVTRPQHMQKYVQWISRVIHFLETDRKAQNMLWSDSTYGGDLTVARVVYNLPFYPLHAFLGERLVQYFFNSRGANIMTAEEYIALSSVVN